MSILFTKNDYDAVQFYSTLHPRIQVLPMYYNLGFSYSEMIYGRRVVLDRLISALALLPTYYGFLIWDIYRPRAVQAKLFEWMLSEIRKKRADLSVEETFQEATKYMSLPSRPGDLYCPPHLSGGAIDLTLYGYNKHEILDLGTPFDDCSELAHSNYFEIHPPRNMEEEAIKSKRLLLKRAMQSQGFTSYFYEWWHFDLGNIFWSRATGKKAVFGPLFGDKEWPMV